MYQAAADRYDTMEYKRCGRSGLKLPRIALGLWQNFGLEKTIAEQEEILCHAFDHGITHFDLANNYGHPSNGLAEKNFGQALKDCLGTYRDELVISTKAGYDMWPGPYVDIFYHHRPDPETPIEETMGALSDIVCSGKALYVGLSNYKEEETRKAVKILKENGTPCLIHQPRYNMLERWVEDGLLSALDENGVGCICFSPLAQGALTDKYLKGIPAGSRASREGTTVAQRYLSDKQLKKIKQLNQLAEERGQTLAQMAIAWILRRPEVTTVLVGASRVSQLDNSLAALGCTGFSEDDLKRIDEILA